MEGAHPGLGSLSGRRRRRMQTLKNSEREGWMVGVLGKRHT